jgi:hypothetical protein
LQLLFRQKGDRFDDVHGLHYGGRLHRACHGVQLRLLRGDVMSLLRSKKFGFSALAFGVLAFAAAQGCSSGDDDNQATPTGGTSSGGAAGHAGTNNGGTNAAGTSSAGKGGTSATAGSGGAAGATETGMAGEGGAVDCNGPDGCYNCAPTNDVQFLNHCVEGGCQPAQDFHLPATLPALP